MSNKVPDEKRGEGLPENIASYIDDARKVAERLANEENCAAAFLVGPMDKHRITPASDLHIVLLLRKLDGVVYRHVLQRFGPVKRRLEIGCFSIGDFERMLSEGMSGYRSMYELEKLREPVVLLDKDGIVDDFKESAKTVGVSRMLVGQGVSLARDELRAAEHALNGNVGGMDDASGTGDTSGMNDAMTRSVRLSRNGASTVLGNIMLAKYRMPPLKVQWVYGRAKERVGKDILEKYDVLQGIEGYGPNEAERVLKDVIGLVRHLLDAMNIDMQRLFSCV